MQRKVWVAIWHHKHGTSAEAATSRWLAQKIMAERVIERWKCDVAMDDAFEFIETDVHEESR